MYSDNIFDDVKINNIIEERNQNSVNDTSQQTNVLHPEQIDNTYSKNSKIAKSLYKYTLAFLVFTSWVYGLVIVSMTKNTDHNIHSLTWLPLLLGAYINMLLFGFFYFIGDY